VTLRELLSNIANYFGEIFSMIAEVPSSFVNSFLDAPLEDILFFILFVSFIVISIFAVKTYSNWLTKWIERFERGWVRLLIFIPINPLFVYFYVLIFLIFIAVETGFWE